MTLHRLLPVLCAALLVAACAGNAAPASTPAPPQATHTAVPESTATATATQPPAPTSTPKPAPTATPVVVRQDIRATHLAIPAIGLDALVQGSTTVPVVYVPDPGCPPGPQDGETLTVPEQGIATPTDMLEGLENKSWIFGHSRWLGTPGLFFGLQDLEAGDELFLSGADRDTGEPVAGQRYVVDGLYLSDVDSGDTFLTAQGPEDIPDKPTVILQTSVRERGAGKPWILDRETLLARAENVVEGDLDDPCKYLLLFVTASRT